jgi:hypothetical protein
VSIIEGMVFTACVAAAARGLRALVLAVLLCGCAVTGAQAGALPACIPKTIWTPFGTGTDWVRGQADADGVTTSWRGWWCPLPDGSWVAYAHLSVERPEWPLNRIDSELSTVFRSADRVAALRDIVNRYSVAPTAAELPAWKAAATQAGAALAAIKPAAVVRRWAQRATRR